MQDGDVVIAAITSCTNTSNPSVMLAAGLVASKARERGLVPKPWVKTSLTPGSRVVSRYLEAAGLQESLDALGFAVAGYSCATCVGASGPLDGDLEERDRRERRSSPARSCPGTATSRPASMPPCVPPSSRARRSWWPSRSPAR